MTNKLSKEVINAIKERDYKLAHQLLDTPDIDKEEMCRVGKLCRTGERFFTLISHDIKRTLEATQDLTDNEVLELTHHFGLLSAGWYLREYGSNVKALVSMYDLVSKLSGSEGYLSQDDPKVNFLQLGESKTNHLLDWYLCEEPSIRERVLRWYTESNIWLEHLVQFDSTALHAIGSSKEPYSTGIRRLLTGLLPYLDASASDLIHLGPRVLAKVEYVRDLVWAKPQRVFFRAGLSAAIKAGTVEQWLDHIIEYTTPEDTIGGSSYRQARA